MALKSKGFFLNLEEGPSTDQAIQMAPVRDLPDEDTQEKSLAPIPAISKTTDGSGTSETDIPAQAVSTSVTAAALATAAAPVTAEPKASAPLPAAAAGSLTTAEAIASALAEAEAARPVARLRPKSITRTKHVWSEGAERRRPGRNLKGFRDMASELFSS